MLVGPDCENGGGVAATRLAWPPDIGPDAAAGPSRSMPSSPDQALAPVILVIDDAEDTRDLYAEFLTRIGLRVAMARDGEEALGKAREIGPALVVLDLGLPGMDGYELVRRLKADPVTSSVPVIVVSGHAQPETKKRALEAGVVEYCVKPCPPTDLVEMIQRHLGRRP